MSHLDDLDEFEAELELALKREYSAVFSLFRFCVLTQDATYLCNKLDLEALPQVSYPYFHIRMEDVWVWDKNRPSRIIPRAEVYTSGDVTVEELRGEARRPASPPRLSPSASVSRSRAKTNRFRKSGNPHARIPARAKIPEGGRFATAAWAFPPPRFD